MIGSIGPPPVVTTETDFQFRVIVRDSAGQTYLKDWTVNVLPPATTNQDPVFVTDELSVDSDSGDGVSGEFLLPDAQTQRSYSYIIDAYDPDPNQTGQLHYCLIPTDLGDGNYAPVPHWLSIDDNGELRGVPTDGDLGSHHVTVQVNDGLFTPSNDGQLEAGVAEQTFKIEVTELAFDNEAPRFRPVTDIATQHNQTLHYDVEAFDFNNDTLEYSVLSGPDGLVVNSSTGRVSWQPSKDQLGEVHVVTLSVTDGELFVEHFLPSVCCWRKSSS